MAPPPLGAASLNRPAGKRQRQVAAGIADSRLRTIPNTGHMTMLESPEVFNTVLLDSLATLDL